MKTNKDNDDTIEAGSRLSKVYRGYNLYCDLERKHTRHGVEDKRTEQIKQCLSCGRIIIMHILDGEGGRNKTEKSNWESYTKYKDQVDLSPPPQKRHKKRWDIKYLILRGNKT